MCRLIKCHRRLPIVNLSSLRLWLPMIYSRQIRAILQEHVNSPVRYDPRSQPMVDIYLGYRSDLTCKVVLERGRANFSSGHNHPTYGVLTADERVLLYCYFIMKGHLKTASAIYRMNQAALESLFSPDARVLFVDVGCGPATACLALADLVKSRTFGYFGIDSATPMQNKALTLWQAAQSTSLIGPESTARFAPSWEEIDLGQLQEDTRVFLVFSYFFASHSLNGGATESLVRFVCALRGSPKITMLIMVYMNASFASASRNYVAFKRRMGLPETKAAELRPGTEYEVLRLKGASA